MNNREKTLISIEQIQEKATEEKAIEAFEKLKARLQGEQSKLDDQQISQHGNIMHGKVSGKITREQEAHVKKLHSNARQMMHERYVQESVDILEKHDPKAFKEYQDEQLTIKGANHGYELSKRDPELAQQLTENIRDITSPYANAFKTGREEYFGEKIDDKLKARDAKLKEFQKERDRIVSKDKDKGLDIER